MAGASLDQAKPNVPDPPACESVVEQVAGESVGRNPWSRGGHTQVAGSGAFSKNGGTHTAPLRGAHVKNLNSHLKSLRNKRKERQKEQR